MAIITYLGGATGYGDSFTPYVVPTPSFSLTSYDAPGAASYTENGVTWTVDWYLSAQPTGEGNPNSVAYTGTITSIQVGDTFIIESSQNYPVVQVTSTQTQWGPILRYARYPEVGESLRDYSLGDTFLGNDFDNTIFSEHAYLHWRDQGWSGIGIGSNLGNDEIYAGGGDDRVSGGWGTDLFDGGAGFDYYMAHIQKSETIKYSGFTPTAGAGINTVLPEGAGVQVNLSEQSFDVVAAIAGLDQPDWMDLQSWYPSANFLGTLAANSIVDSFQLDDELADTTVSIEGVQGSNLADVIVAHGATAGPDIAIGPGGVAYGAGGNDVLIATLGTAFISGGSGNDLIIGSGGDDLANGDEGADNIFGGAGSDTLWGGEGWDYLDGEEGFDWYNTFNESDRVHLNLSPYLLNLITYIENDWINWTDVSLRLPFGVNATLAERVSFGENESHETAGTRDLLVNFEGVRGTKYNDFIVTAGLTTLEHQDLGPGSVAYGENGDDIIFATWGTAFISGGGGSDLLISDALAGQSTTVHGDQGNDFLLGSEGNDVLRGMVGHDFIDGGDGNDTIEGEGEGSVGLNGRDTLQGGEGDDHIDPGDGDDWVDGGGGSDTIKGATGGNSVIYGGDNVDTVVYEEDWSNYTTTFGSTVLLLEYYMYKTMAGSLSVYGYKIQPEFKIKVVDFGFAEDTLKVDVENISVAGFVIDDDHFADVLYNRVLNGMMADFFAAAALFAPPAAFASIGFRVLEAINESRLAPDSEKEAFVQTVLSVSSLGFDKVIGRLTEKLPKSVKEGLPLLESFQAIVDAYQNKIRQKVAQEYDDTLRPIILDIRAEEDPVKQDEKLTILKIEMVKVLASSILAGAGAALDEAGKQLVESFLRAEVGDFLKFLPIGPALDNKAVEEAYEAAAKKVIVVEAGQNDVVEGTLAELDGVVVVRSEENNSFIIRVPVNSTDSITSEASSAVFRIDADLDGEYDATVTVLGDFVLENFEIKQFNGYVDITYTEAQVRTAPFAFDDDFLLVEGGSLHGSLGDDNRHGADYDPEGTALTYSIVSGPPDGNLNLSDDGSFTYIADFASLEGLEGGQSSTQKYFYQVEDENGETDIGIASFEVFSFGDPVEPEQPSIDDNDDMHWRSTTFFLKEEQTYVDGDFVYTEEQMLEGFVGFLDAWADHGLNSVSLTWFVPVDPITGEILDDYGPDVPSYLRGLPSDERLALFTGAAHDRGFDVSWKTNFIPNQAGEGNVNDFFAPSIDVANFLAEVEAYWAALAPKAEANDVELVIIGGEQGGYAGPTWDAEWRDIIDAVRASYLGEVTYDALGYVGHPTVAADDITFWDALDYIGISMYLPLANDDTPTLSEAYHLLRNNQSFEGQTPVDVPAVLENLASTYGKQVLFTEIGGNSSVGSLANPPVSYSETSFYEQSILYATHLDTFSQFDWVAGMNWWNNASELSNPPNSEFWDFWYTITEKQFPFMGKPSGDLVKAFWGNGNNGAPISGDVVLGDEGDDSLSGAALDDILIGSLGNDTLSGFDGSDRLMGGDGSDLIHGDGGHDVIYGGSSHRDQGDTVLGGTGNDFVHGGFGGDDIDGGSGSDTLFGQIGNDTLEGGSGDDTLDGGEGNDTLRGQDGADSIDGDAGDDRLEGGLDNDLLDGGDDNDELFGGGSGDDTLIGGRGSDFLFGENGNDWMDGGDGFDLLNGGTDADTMLGGNGNDRLFGNLGFDSLEGGAGNDTLYGGPSGNDTLIGDDGNDEMYGEAGADILIGGDGLDTLRGGTGNDQLFGGNDDDLIEGGAGNDQLYGGPTGEDTLLGGQGSDFLFAEGADDTMDGGDGFDLMNGGAGNDLMLGGNGNDRLEGNLGEDTLDGGAGDDELYGGNGGSNDALIGGTGNDTLVGEAGNDTFIFADGFGVDVINDFDEFSSAEVINLAAVTSITDYTDLSTNHMSQSGGNVLIDAGGGNTITVLNALVADMGADDFGFG